ncbi:MAG: 1-deoxy-D-xylulose-5-phosphate reductoisomerase [Micrococcaceae bacterium]
MRTVTLLGSTGSIGTQALEVIQENSDEFKVYGLSCGNNVELIVQQAIEFQTKVIAISLATEQAVVSELKKQGANPNKYQILVGKESSAELAAQKVDIVLNGMTGAVGLKPTLEALKAGNTLALANKESLIIGGELVKSLAQADQIVPVDSEHSAIAQCLMSTHHPIHPYEKSEVNKLVLTASGGPFRGKTKAELKDVTPQQALAHPTWDMGRVVTTNSATLVNKGLEVIEAHLLFDVPLEKIDVVVHPQSVVHSMVQFQDGSTIAQCSPPDMKLPIALGIAYPNRVKNVAEPCDWTKATSWTFEPLDQEAFPAVKLAKYCATLGKTMPAVFNAANEEAVDAFHDGLIKFTDIVDIVQQVVDQSTVSQEMTLETVLAADQQARADARELIEGLS